MNNNFLLDHVKVTFFSPWIRGRSRRGTFCFQTESRKPARLKLRFQNYSKLITYFFIN